MIIHMNNSGVIKTNSNWLSMTPFAILSTDREGLHRTPTTPSAPGSDRVSLALRCVEGGPPTEQPGGGDNTPRGNPSNSEEGGSPPEQPGKGGGSPRDGITHIPGRSGGESNQVNSDYSYVSSGELREEFLSELVRVTRDEGDLTRRKMVKLKGRRIDKRLLTAVDDLIINELKQEGNEASLWTLNCLVCTGAVVVDKHLRRIRRDHRKNNGEAPGKEAEVKELRKQVGWVSTELWRRNKGLPLTGKQGRNLKTLQKLYSDTSTANLRRVLETLKMRLKIRTKQIRRCDTFALKLTTFKIIMHFISTNIIKPGP